MKTGNIKMKANQNNTKTILKTSAVVTKLLFFNLWRNIKTTSQIITFFRFDKVTVLQASHG